MSWALLLGMHSLVGALGADKLTVESCNVAELDVLGALGSAGTCIGAVTESQFVHLGQHGLDALLGLGTSLGQQCKLADLSAHEEHCRTILASSHTSTTANTRSTVHSLIGGYLADGDGIGILCATGVEAHITTCLLNLIEGIAVDHEVFQHREGGTAPRLNGDGLAIVEAAHIKLASGCSRGGAVGVTIDIERAHAADTLAAVVVKVDGLLALLDELLIEDIEHLEERGVSGNVLHLVGLEVSLLLRSSLTPHFQFEAYAIFHFA